MSVKLSGQTVQPKKIKTVPLWTLSWPPSLSTFFVAFTVFGSIQSKNEVALLEVSIFKKSAKTEVKIFGRQS